MESSAGWQARRAVVIGSARGAQRALLSAGLWVLCATLPACQSPTLPLPPPAKPDIAQLTSQGQVTLVGAQAIPGANVMVFNFETESGIIMTANSQGVYRGVIPVDLSVHTTNPVEMWQRVGLDDSSPVSFSIPYGSGHPLLDDADAPPSADAATSSADAASSADGAEVGLDEANDAGTE